MAESPANKTMKVLYVTSKPPYPKVDGGCFASARFLQTLIHAGIRVHHFTIATQKHPFEIEEYPISIRNVVKPESITIDTRIKPVKAIKGILSNGSYNVDRFYNEEVKKHLQGMLADQPDIVILDSLYSSVYLKIIRETSNVPVFLRAHNVEYLIWEELAENQTSLVKKKLYARLAKDLRKYELGILDQFSGILTITQEDRDIYVRNGIKCPMSYIPIPVENPSFEPDYSVSELFHIGSMHWAPNAESIQLLMEWIQDIEHVVPGIKIHLAGSGLEGKFQELFPEIISEDGFVEDVYQYAKDRGILISPMMSGSGVRVKILEMMALGIPIITTSKGAQGIGDKEAVRIADTKGEFIAAIADLTANFQERTELGKKARHYIAESHTMERISHLLTQALGLD